MALRQPVLAGRRPVGTRLALGASLLLHGAAMAWMLQEAPPVPETPAPRVQIALLEAPRPQVQPEPQPQPAPPEATKAPPVAVEAPRAPARPDPVPAEKPMPKPKVVRRDPPAVDPEPVPQTVSEPRPVAQAEPAPAVIAPGYEADYLNNPPPAYPRLSRRLREEGEVELRVRVSTAGHPLTVEVAGSSGSERLDAAALQAVRQWRFEPARRGDQAVEAWVRVPILFKLEA